MPPCPAGVWGLTSVPLKPGGPGGHTSSHVCGPICSWSTARIVWREEIIIIHGARESVLWTVSDVLKARTHAPRLCWGMRSSVARKEQDITCSTLVFVCLLFGKGEILLSSTIWQFNICQHQETEQDLSALPCLPRLHNKRPLMALTGSSLQVSRSGLEGSQLITIHCSSIWRRGRVVLYPQ